MADTPLDPRYKKGFYLDAAQLVGRVRTRKESISNNQVDFLALDEQGNLLVALGAVLEKLDEVVNELKQMNEAMASLR